MAPDADGSPASTLTAPARRLWPEPAQLSRGTAVPHGNRLVARYLAVPDADEPRLLLPLRPRRAAAAGLRRTGRRSGRLGRAARTAAAAALAMGAGDLLPGRTLSVSVPRDGHDGPRTVERMLADALGQPVALVVQLGRPRANRKPVVEVVDTTGRPLAYAKVAVDPLTARLVAAEAETLRQLAAADLRVVRAPQVLLAQDGVLVQQALTSGRRPTDADLDLVRAAEDEVAALSAVPAARLDATYGSDLRRRVADVPAGAARDATLRLVEALLAGYGRVETRLGTWHGDWTPWNLTVDGGRVNTWDWERFGGAVPVGFDRLHYELQRDLVVHLAEPPATVAALLDDAAAGAERLRHPATPPDDVLPLACAYLLELATRYLADGQADAGARLGAVDRWLLPAVERRLT